MNGNEWIFLTPTVHALLEHSGELIEANNCKGLGISQNLALNVAINLLDFLE